MKIGIEIHQRLASHKLFCECASEISDTEQPSLTVMRQLRPVMSELKEIDAASRAEFAKRKTHEYQIFERNNCLVELDEEPPHPLNQDALGIALQISMHLNAKPVDEVHFMRKIIIDGSAVSGFQRTAVIAMDGRLETSRGKIQIQQLSLEEESSGIVADTTGSGKSVFRLDRLGIPLVEITTSADIVDGQHLLEVAEKLGTIMRATGKVARGLGTIRQDVNVSTEGGARVEIKGAQDLKMLPVLVEQEVLRQNNLLKILAELKSRGFFKSHLSHTFADVSSIFGSTESKLVKNGIEAGHKVLALKLPNHAGLIGTEIQTGRRYGTELSDYAKTAGVKGIIHSDEDMKKYTISETEFAEIRKILGISNGANANTRDAFVLVVAEQKTAEKSLEKVCERAEMTSIPKETRRANPDGSTSYMRPLPGRARMYPETDIPPVQITKEMIAELHKTKGESLEEKKARLSKMLNPEFAEKMLKSKNLGLFEKIADEFGTEVEPMLVANTLENTLVSLRREGVELKDVEGTLSELFSLYVRGRFVKAAIPEIIKLVAKGEDVESAIKNGKLEKISGKELEKIAAENNFDVGKIMQKYRLNVDAGELGKVKRK